MKQDIRTLIFCVIVIAFAVLTHMAKNQTKQALTLFEDTHEQLKDCLILLENEHGNSP